MINIPELPRGDCNDTLDEHAEKDRRKPLRVVFLKCIRGRNCWPEYVVGYYRWNWMANLVAWWVFTGNNGDTWVEKTGR